MASHLGLANTSAPPAAPTAPVAPAPLPAPAAAAAPPNGLFRCCLCGSDFTRRSTIFLRHWPRCERRRGNPNGLQWDSHPSCRATAYVYRTAANGPPAAPPAAPHAAPLVAPLAAPVAAPPAATVAAPLAAPLAALLAAPPAPPTRRSSRHPSRRPTRRPRPTTAAAVAAPPTANFVGNNGDDDDDAMSQGEGETGAYGPPRWSHYHYMDAANWLGRQY
ncbi:hypothetical protein MMC17_004301 [Xylographa soralifera]|nr:hypothetical protein [Xylographa soralifera]